MLASMIKNMILIIPAWHTDFPPHQQNHINFCSSYKLGMLMCSSYSLDIPICSSYQFGILIFPPDVLGILIFSIVLARHIVVSYHTSQTCRSMSSQLLVIVMVSYFLLGIVFSAYQLCILKCSSYVLGILIFSSYQLLILISFFVIPARHTNLFIILVGNTDFGLSYTLGIFVIVLAMHVFSIVLAMHTLFSIIQVGMAHVLASYQLT